MLMLKFPLVESYMEFEAIVVDDIFVINMIKW